MSRNSETITVKKQYEQITSGTADVLSFQVLQGTIEILPSIGNTRPSESRSGYRYEAGQGVFQLNIVEDFRLAGGNTLWARSIGNLVSSQVIVSHS